MKKTNSKKVTSWLLTAVFLAFMTVFSLFDQPSALAQSEIPPVTTESTSTPIVSPSPVIPPTLLPVNTVAANVQRLLTTNECVGCNLVEAQLDNANLQAANLAGANLQEAELEKANLQGTNLTSANLQGVDLSKANLAGANLQGANLFDADLEAANLLGADLQGANLQKADLQKTNLTNANIQGANLLGADLEDALIPPGFTNQYQ
ncbi:pentapeptide repeat-containing protein [Nostoc sphaeroides]|uniref:Pentapeptide repeat-containing protein n=1 Tax=Nostoc sphaeroides CCNUC1 TaxID=2653204 RepID=A0A5P8WBL8_9NOSO|nr:pentapeptide repeat-containing protein [Nostoc sphaeroides]MCC5632088.1 pentapeptide repeat-containing protein [Nostoc sphaeroides CHAB 2801]QFS50004.1 pentapeptide repeat-containing protein [Nostoc sphaeroides CCNUC1]